MSTFQRWACLTGGMLVLLLVADTAAWWWLTGRVIAQYASWREAQATQGIVITTGPVTRAGWPWRAAVALPDAAAAGTSLPNAPLLSWHAERVLLVYVPWRPYTLSVQAAGRQTLRAGGAPALSLDSETFDATIPLDPAQAGTMALEASELTVMLPPGAPVSPLKLQRLSLTIVPGDADLTLRGMVLPGAPIPLPFGGLVDAGALHAHISGPLPFFATRPAAALAAWRQAGGQLQITAMALRWGPLDATGEATLTLDMALQPQGAGSVRLSGYGELLDALRAAGTVTPGGALVAGAMLGLLSKTTASGREVDLPLTLRDRVLTAGSFPLLRVPEFTWP